MTIPEQIGGMPLAQFADISARMVGLQTAEQCYEVVRHVLDMKGRTLPASAGEALCGYCNARWTL